MRKILKPKNCAGEMTDTKDIKSREMKKENVRPCWETNDGKIRST